MEVDFNSVFQRHWCDLFAGDAPTLECLPPWCIWGGLELHSLVHCHQTKGCLVSNSGVEKPEGWSRCRLLFKDWAALKCGHPWCLDVIRLPPLPTRHTQRHTESGSTVPIRKKVQRHFPREQDTSDLGICRVPQLVLLLFLSWLWKEHSLITMALEPCCILSPTGSMGHALPTMRKNPSP